MSVLGGQAGRKLLLAPAAMEGNLNTEELVTAKVKKVFADYQLTLLAESI